MLGKNHERHEVSQQQERVIGDETPPFRGLAEPGGQELGAPGSSGREPPAAPERYFFLIGIMSLPILLRGGACRMFDIVQSERPGSAIIAERRLRAVPPAT